MGNTEGCEEVERWSKNRDYRMKKYVEGGEMSLASRQKGHVVCDQTTCKKKGLGGFFLVSLQEGNSVQLLLVLYSPS